MTSRQRVEAALSHKAPDRVPLDFGATPTSGIHASLVYQLRRAFGLPERPIKLSCSYQMLGEIEEDLAKCLEIDTAMVMGYANMYGIRNADWKRWALPDGTPVLVPGGFNTVPEPRGDLLQYPLGDKAHGACARMPKNGYYCDAVIRQREIDDDALNVEDNLEEFAPFSDEYLRYMETETQDAYERTERAIVGAPGGCALGDIALVPGLMLEDPKGIRDVEEWYVSLITRKDYIMEIYDRQTQIALLNLEGYRQAVGDRISAIYLCGNDFGTQNSTFLSAQAFEQMYLPFYRRMTDWIHKNTAWKVFKHSCGAVEPLIESFIKAGIDILNPVQCSCPGMEPEALKRKYGQRIAFWGGGVDTQHTLPFGAPEQVFEQVRQRVEAFKPDGGFVFSTIHNAQCGVPVENFLAMLDAFKAAR